MKNYKQLFLSNDQYLIDSETDFKKRIPEIIKLINQYASIDFDWSKPEETNNLTEDQLVNIQKIVAHDVQANLVTMFSPYIDPHLKRLFGDQLEYKIRVSAQVKGRWSRKVGLEPRKGGYVNGAFVEDKENPDMPSLSFPTRAHQDLDNNGNRGSHTMIFYFQLTEALPHSSVLQFGEFPEKIGMFPFSTEWGYPNEILHSTQKQINWHNGDLKPGNVVLMTGINPHRSGLIGEMPRIALNVKIQPSNLAYLENIYGVSLSVLTKGHTITEKLNILKDILIDLSQKHRQLLYELAVTYFLLGEMQKSKEALKGLCLFDIDDNLLERWTVASILKKVMDKVTEEELLKSVNALENVVPLSCGDAIMKTIDIHS